MEKENVTAAKMIVSLVFGGFLVIFLLFFSDLFLKARRRRSRLEKQGIKGPLPSLFYGNIPEMKRIIGLENEKSRDREDIVHGWFHTVFPHLEQWRNEYGPTFLYSAGNIQILCITDPEMAKEVSLCTSLNLGKPSYLSTDRGPLLGRGILSSNGQYWVHQRKIIAPQFYLDKVKGMVNLMAESTLAMLKTWENKIESWGGKVKITVDEDLRSLSADIISRACFGSSYTEGELIFTKLHALQRTMSKGNFNVGVPGLRYLPTKHNKEIWKLEAEINAKILQVVKCCSTGDNNKKNLVQLLLSAAESYGDDSNIPADITPKKFIVDNCKNIYFAGHETTAISASWCLMTLAAYPEWQTRARQEVLQICGTNIPTAEMLRNMKVLTTIILETLRLYPPVAYVVREALEDIHFKEIHIPKGINIQIPIPIMHHRRDLWGPDAHQFEPDRFANGISGACRIPQAYMPFGMGTRICAGQNFAMTELKLILSLILSKFSFSLSPEYRHSPVFGLVVQPQHGVNILLRKI
ncbi:Cytochrome P450 CYP4/CYP19/CYP26 subfamily [Handroanthus impetiginosus]|uniref:Cytochrome P450 CYP4/CYP19/CYP26 subfamily n=1 Tax=Handroanthus impetiginosus TaxID=429701 RepID=A0A2G9GML4_9LAMI|nr:Cytochrome P450 CYP4/CYP19/CYP26 subfamily [Handroanthus impetiginosus]